MYRLLENTLCSYEIIFNTDGGDALEGLSYFYNTQNQEITLPEATKTGYAFKEWTIVTNTTKIKMNQQQEPILIQKVI